MEIAAISDKMRGFTFVREVLLDIEPLTGDYALRLVLFEAPRANARCVTAKFEAVSRLSISDFGGGWTQLMYLAVEDVSADQWDRVRYRVQDLEHERISFLCLRIDVSDPMPSTALH
jgi:hypothetical protein